MSDTDKAVPLRDEVADMAELMRNGGQYIKWAYWFQTIPFLTSAHAARLMRGLDPNLHADLGIQSGPAPNVLDRVKAGEHDSYPARLDAYLIEQAAISQRLEEQTAILWLEWAEKHAEAIGFKIHENFRRAVEIVPTLEAANFAEWTSNHRTIWHLHAGVTLLLSYEPVPEPKAMTEVTGRIRDAAQRAEWERIYRMAKEDERKGQLKSLGTITGLLLDKKIERDLFIAWAESRGIRVPEGLKRSECELADAASSPRRPVGKGEIIATYEKFKDKQANKKWWDDMSRAAFSRSKLPKASRGRAQIEPTFYPDEVAAWLIERGHMRSGPVIQATETAFPWVDTELLRQICPP